MVKKEEEGKGKEGKNLLGRPKFKKLDNGRFKCVETGHEVPSHAKDSYAQSKHCRIGLIDAALARDIVNKSEEHIWKHINGKRFLNMLEKKEAEKETPNGFAEPDEQPPEKISQPKADSTKKKKKKKKPEEDVAEVISEVKNSSDKVNGTEEVDFWMPPVGERWDFDDGGDRWASDSESGSETEDANGADAATEEGKDDAMEISKRCFASLTKRMSIEIGPSNYASRKKKNKTKST
ncbi:hypothetical protein TEA_020481 [Camellia sinensis var. sinensis]|uniref:Surfeit locus protein 2 n=1 Tax=Camellia sinensis var. sinensis TaxID=542762 RepID=A0A4S4D4D0_CAMSN|nr:hypothetical protein TEA_020481 [Camellia sinensis var. sinensis]